MLTRKGYNGILARIMETGGMTPEMEADVRKLRDEFDEREGILRRYGETYDGEGESDEYEFKERPIKTYEKEYQDLREKYQGLVGRYNDMVFYSDGTRPKPDTVLEEDENGKDSTTEDIRINDLLVDIS